MNIKNITIKPVMSVAELKSFYQSGNVPLKRVYVESQYEEGRFIAAVLDIISEALPVIAGVADDGGIVFRVAAGNHQMLFHTGFDANGCECVL